MSFFVNRDQVGAYSFLSDVLNVDVFGAFVIMISGKAKLMHHPLGFGALSSVPTIVYQRFLESNAFTAFSTGWIYWPVDASGFPESRTSNPIRSYTVSVFSTSSAKEVPFFVSHSTGLCIPMHQKKSTPWERERERERRRVLMFSNRLMHADS